MTKEISRNKNWTREELIIAFNLYCKTPFGQINSKSAEFQLVAKRIGRSSSALAIKLANFARLDPALQGRNIAGMRNGSKADELIWAEFHGDWERLAEESERLSSGFGLAPLETNRPNDILAFEDGEEREAMVNLRLKQSFFRRSVLASYNFRCCITGIAIPELLIASHIVPWAADRRNRLNPANGLCLNALHDRAFDAGLITVLPNFTVKASKQIKAAPELGFLAECHGRRIETPLRFRPDPDFLEFHNQNIFK